MNDPRRAGRLAWVRPALTAIFALSLSIAPFAGVAQAAEDGSVAQGLADHLYVPDGVEGGIEVTEDGMPKGLSPEYGRLDTAGGSSSGGRANLPSKYDLRDKGYVSAVKNQLRWQNCWVFASMSSLESNLLVQGRGSLAGNDFSERQLTQARRTLVSSSQAERLGAVGQAGEGVEPIVNVGDYGYVHSDNDFLLSSGYIYEAGDAMFNGMGPVAEKTVPSEVEENSDMYWVFGPMDDPDMIAPVGATSWRVSDPYAYDPVLWIDESLSLGTLGIVNDQGVYEGVDWDAVSRVKQAVMSDGAVSVGIYSGGSVSSPSFSDTDTEYYNAEHAAQFVSDTIGMGHFVAIVGWDDTFPKENFVNSVSHATPEGDGAWIIKDSYGTIDSQWWSHSGEDGTGFRYVSYYDRSLDYTCQLVAGPNAASDDVTLQYDLLGTSPYSDALLVDQAASAANVFTAEQDMLLEATTASTITDNSTVKIEVYLLGAGASSPTDGTLAGTTTKTYAIPGRYRVDLSKPIEIREGQRFSIVETVSSSVVDGSSSGTMYYLALECGTTSEYAKSQGYDHHWNAVSNAGESWVMTNGSWADAKTLNGNAELTTNGKVYGNALIKAYGSEADLPPASESTKTVTMWRLYNQYTGEHLYTSSKTEYDNLGKIGWTQENVAWIAPAEGEEVYRLYNPYSSDHHYTMKAGERDALVKLGWKDEGVGWHSAPAGSGVPLYRLFNPYEQIGTHHYTTSTSERDQMVKNGWINENIAWYGVKS